MSDPATSTVEPLIPALARAFGMGYAQAGRLYADKLQHPLVPLQCIWHMRLDPRGRMEPVVKNVDLERVVAAARALIAAPTDDGAAQRAPGKRPKPAEDASSGDTDAPPFLRHKRACLEAALISGKITETRFSNVTRALQLFTDVAHAVEAEKGLADKVRRALLDRCNAALLDAVVAESDPDIGRRAAPDDPNRPIVVSHLVREHLGYFPAQGGSELRVAIGRAARKHMITELGRVPQKRAYFDEQGETRETNSYVASDAPWLRVLVARECARLKHYPRPSVAMARGETVYLADGECAANSDGD